MTSVANTQFEYLKVQPQVHTVDLAGRWDNGGLTNAGETDSSGIDTSDDSLHQSVFGGQGDHAIMLKNLRLQKFQATFRTSGPSWAGSAGVSFMFNATDSVMGETVYIPHETTSGAHVSGHGRFGDMWYSTGTGSTGLPAIAITDWRWIRVTCDGSTVVVKCIDSNGSAPSDSSWTSATTYFSTSYSGFTGGLFGFVPAGVSHVDDLTLKSWNGSAWVTELVDDFSIDGSGYAADTLTYDNNGNLLYDGTQSYTYDGWNRLITVAHAYRDGSGVHSGQVFATMAYDASGRRIMKTIDHTGILDATTHYNTTKSAVFNGAGLNAPTSEHPSTNSILETRDGSSTHSSPKNHRANVSSTRVLAG